MCGKVRLYVPQTHLSLLTISKAVLQKIKVSILQDIILTMTYKQYITCYQTVINIHICHDNLLTLVSSKMSMSFFLQSKRNLGF